MKIKTAAGALFICSQTERVLLNLRAPYKSHALKWSLWGGMAEKGETPLECLNRELNEELGGFPNIEKFCPIDIFQSPDKKFMYFSYICIVQNEFIPVLNHENCGYCWSKLGIWPKPLHYGARKTLCNKSARKKIDFILSQYPRSST